MIFYRFLFAALMINAQISSAQSFQIDPITSDTINMINCKGKKEGKWVVFGANNKFNCYGDKQKICEGNYLNDKKNGTWHFFYCNGKFKKIIEYQNDYQIGRVAIYFENGVLSEEGYWAISHWVGKKTSFHKNGNIKEVFLFDLNGKRTGLQKYYFENGNVSKTCNHYRGKKVGILKAYSTEGRLISESKYENGRYIKTCYFSHKKTESCMKN